VPVTMLKDIFCWASTQSATDMAGAAPRRPSFDSCFNLPPPC
jgi:hypothetical protein